MANLFGKNKLRGIAEKISTEEITPFIEIVKEWHEDYHNGSLKLDKETSREQEYNQQFFKTILGYKEKPASPFSFEPKATTDKGQLPDAVISYTDKTNDTRNIAAVVELKGASIDLDRPQRREGNFSPVQQGFKYKAQYRSCPFVIVSNFWEFRLYRDNLLDYEVWTLDDLVNPDDDYILFKTWYVLLCRDNFTASKGASKTETLLSDIRVEQEDIGKRFYRVYREARLDLLRDVYKNNPRIRTNIDLGIEKTQKIVDRIVFAAFAEDRGLLPDNSLVRVIQAADNSAFGGSLWDMLKGFFNAIDVGSEKLEIPDGYNGGLFKRDDKLNNLEVSDEPLRKVLELGSYNFAEDLSVNILGHIFEQSISDLEEIKNKVNESQNLEALAQSRRKKDGIFYTPDYIVRFIVDNSLGAYLREHEDKFKNEFGLKDDIQDKTYEKREKQAYSKYQDFLHNVKVVDPACGSGAFLVYVFDYLLAENKRVNDILGNSLFSSEDYVRDILRNNIYGVDLNEESVEITKLSLWLKTAQKGKKLTTLDANIKCGNSLIDSPDIADSKAFDWHKQFPDIFKNGGFDVVVMNPPYVRSRSGSFINEKDYFYANFKWIFEKPNLYLLFIEKTIGMLKQGGYLGFIVPNSILATASAIKVREAILEDTTLHRVINLQGESFKGVSVETAIVALSKQKSVTNTTLYQNLLTPEMSDANYQSVEQSVWQRLDTKMFDVVSNDGEQGLIQRLSALTSKVGNHYQVRVGLQAYEKGKGSPKQTEDDVKNHVFDYNHKFDENTYPYIEGKSVGRYWLGEPSYWLRWGEWLSQPKTLEQFSGSRLVIREITSSTPYLINATYAEDRLLNNKSILNISPVSSSQDLLSLLGILNSKLISFYHQRRAAKGNRSLFPKIVANDLKNYPLPSGDIGELGEPVRKMLAASSDLQLQLTNFCKLVKVPSALGRWWTMDFTDFTNALKPSLSLTEKDELLPVFNKYRADITRLDEEVRKLDHEIDQLVYRLYNLTPEEIQSVESGL